MSKQLTFPGAITATVVHPDGRKQKLIYGHYEAVMITKENGHDVHRTKKLHACRYPVTSVELEDGCKLLFDEPFYDIEKSENKPFNQMNLNEQADHFVDQFTKQIHFHCHFCNNNFSFTRCDCRVQPNPEGEYCCIMPCPKCNRDIETPL